MYVPIYVCTYAFIAADVVVILINFAKQTNNRNMLRKKQFVTTINMWNVLQVIYKYFNQSPVYQSNCLSVCLWLKQK